VVRLPFVPTRRVYGHVFGGYDYMMSQTDKIASKIASKSTFGASGRVTEAMNVVIPLYEGVTLLDIAGPAEALAHVGEVSTARSYRLFYLCCGEADWVTSSTGLPIKGVRLGELPSDIHTLLVTGAAETALWMAAADRPFMATLRRLASRAERLASVCTGAFLLGELGLLDHRRVTTHWAGLAALAARYPAAQVANDRLFETDGRL